MPQFNVILCTDAAWAERTIEAEHPKQALDQALAFDPQRLLFQPFITPLPINEIAITDHAGEEELIWRNAGLVLRLGAEDLLIAAKNVLSALCRGEQIFTLTDACTSESLRHLKEAVDRAQGRIA
jgi:hypothetical protein